MIKMRFFICLVAISLYLRLTYAEQSLQCGDWDVYKDEKCFKVFDSKELQSYEDAKNACYQNEGSSLVSIRSKEEQDYLYNLLHNIHNAVNNAWIGASIKENILKWSDNITVNYTNWANDNPIDQTGYDCVQMEIIEPYHGKWFNVPCNQKNLVVCQKSQNWLFSYLQKTVMELRESFDNITKQLDINKLKLDKNERELLNTKIELENTKISFQKELLRKTAESTPPGTIAYFSNTSTPIGWLKANGQTVSRNTYANLFATIGTTYGSGDGSTTFTLPDLRGEFIRGWSDGRNADKDRAFGSFQWGSSIPYATTIDNRNDIASSYGWYQIRAFAGSTFDGGFHTDIKPNQTINGMTYDGWYYSGKSFINVPYIDTTKGGNITSWSVLEGTRPRNIALLACIKY